MAGEINYSKQLDNICDAIVESVLDMSDEEIAEECREDGTTPEAEAEQVKQVLRAAHAKWKQANEV